MKHIKLIFILLSTFTSISLNGQNKLIEKFAEMDGVTSVYISKTMLSLMPGMQTNGINIGDMASKLEELQILTSEKPEVAAIMRKEVSKIVKDKDYEELMRVKDESSKVNFYIRKEKDKIKELLMLVDDEDEFVIIMLVGNLSLKDIQNITAE